MTVWLRGGASSIRKLVCAVTTVLVAVSSCGCGSSGSATTADAKLRARQDAVIAFFKAFSLDLPIRVRGRNAELRFLSAIQRNPPDLGAAEQALKEALSDTELWRRATENLPATSPEIARIRMAYVQAAGDEVKEARDYLALLANLAAGRTDKKLESSAKALTAKAESLEMTARSNLMTTIEQNGGEALLRRIGVKRLREASQLSKSAR
jgi:hypothetical protein